MAPSLSEMFTQLAHVCKIIREIYKFGAVNSPNFLGMEDALIQTLEGVHTAAITSGLQQTKSVLVGLIDAPATTMLLPILRSIAEYGYSLSPVTVGGNPNKLILEIYRAMVANSHTISSRVVTYSDVTVGGSNAGTGKIYRCTKNRFDKSIERLHTGIVRATCQKDKNTGRVPGNEVFVLEGITAGAGNFRNSLEYGDAASQGSTLNAMLSDSSILRNSSFDQLPSTLSNNEQSGWTFSDYTDFGVITYSTTSADRKLFRLTSGSQSSPTPVGQALVFLEEGSISQYVAREKFSLRESNPYILVARVMRRNSADGTLTMRLGSQTVALDITTLTNDVWTDLVIGGGTTAANAATAKGWFEVFKEDWVDTSVTPNVGLGVRVKFDLASNTTADGSTHQLVIDEVIFSPMLEFNGVYYLATSGQVSEDFLLDDTFQWTDTATDAGTMQYIMARAFGRDLNSTSGSPTYADV